VIVEKLLHEFDDDMSIFERLLVDCSNSRTSTSAAPNWPNSALPNPPAAAKSSSRRVVVRRVKSSIASASTQLPPLVHGVLARAWANHLVLTLLRQGEASPEFRSALHFVDDFIASTRLAHAGSESCSA
jgi:hypothetical protein